MGRGLSTIQKQILCFVWREKFVTCQDLLTMWGVQPGTPVNKNKYCAAHSALSRSLTRLFFRGLITYWQDKLIHYKTAISLTAKGKVLAQAISEKEVDDADNS
jgi:hypothetical protein